MNKRFTPNAFGCLAIHAVFIAGAILLFVYGEGSGRPIHLEQTNLHQVVLVYAIGYLVVFAKWLALIKDRRLYMGNANEVPGYLTRELWGDFPYLGTLGKSNSGNKRLNNKSPHIYQDVDVNGKTFREIFVIHINKNVLLVLFAISTLLPYVFLNQAAPSFLKFVFSSPLTFTIYFSFLILTWLSSIALLILRVCLLAK